MFFFVFLYLPELILQLCCYYCFSLTLLITGSHIVLISMLGRLRRFLWPSICTDSLSLRIFEWCSLSMISTRSHRGGDLPSLPVCGQPRLVFPLPHLLVFLKPHLYISVSLRYVDDTFILWPHQEDVQILLDHMNSIRPSIQFTTEKESNNTLPFLDFLISRTEEGFKISVYRKPTFTGQYLNFNSHHPYSIKKGIVRCLQHRAKVTSGDPETSDKELASISSTLQRNNYPEYMAAPPQKKKTGIGGYKRRRRRTTLRKQSACLMWRGYQRKYKGSAVHITSGQSSKAWRHFADISPE